MGIFDDMNDDLGGSETALIEDIKKITHVANGGTGDNMRPCGGCHGTGLWQGRGRCFACKGAGKVTARVAGAQKGKVTAANNLAAKRTAFISKNMDLYTFLNEAGAWSSFAASMAKAISEYGSLTEKQLAAGYSMMAKAKQRDEERAVAKVAEKAAALAAAPVVELSAIQALFSTATDNAIKRPIFRAETLTISKAPDTGRNAGSLYVKRNEDDVYLGLLRNGKFEARREATDADVAALQAVAADPLAESIKYARKTSSCGCCGKGLVDPISILAGIGPICAEKWGLDYRRNIAAEEYTALKAAEKKGKK